MDVCGLKTCKASKNHRKSILVDVRAPNKRSTVKREHVPYMTPELLDAIRRRNKLKRLHNKSKNSTDPDRYKNQRNFTSSLRRKLISGYLRTTADNAKGNPRTFWRVIKPFMHCRSNTSHDSIHLKEYNILITDKSGVAEVLNKHFSSVLSDSDSTINRHSVVDHLSSSHQSISAIRTHCPLAQPFQFRHVTPPELEIILKSLEPKKATGHDHRELKQLRRQPQRRLQKNNRFKDQNNSSARASRFLVHFFDVHCTTTT